MVPHSSLAARAISRALGAAAGRHIEECTDAALTDSEPSVRLLKRDTTYSQWHDGSGCTALQADHGIELPLSDVELWCDRELVNRRDGLSTHTLRGSELIGQIHLRQQDAEGGR